MLGSSCSARRKDALCLATHMPVVLSCRTIMLHLQQAPSARSSSCRRPQVVMEFSFRWAGTQRVKLLIKPFPPSWGKFAPPGFAQAVSSLLSCKVGRWAAQDACSRDWPAAAYPCRSRQGMHGQHYRTQLSLVKAVHWAAVSCFCAHGVSCGQCMGSGSAAGPAALCCSIGHHMRSGGSP